MNLIPVAERRDRYELLYRLLEERPDYASISHKAMPELSHHKRFVDGNPYEAWYFVVDGDEVVGACYLTKAREIGIGIFAEHQGKKYGREAIKMLIDRHGPGRYLANINPANDKSKFLFSGLGFRKIQDTYELQSA